MSTGQNLYYDGCGTYGVPNFLSNATPAGKPKKKSFCRKNFTTKKMSTGLSLYYDGYGRYSFPQMSFTCSPCRKPKKKKEIKISRL